MGLPVDLLQVQEQGAVVDGRGHLAHAAAQLGLAGAAGDEDRGREITLGGGPLADDIIEGENLAGVENRAVDGLAGQIQVVGSVGVDGVFRGHLVEGCAEHLAGEIQLGDLGLDVLHLNDHGAAGLGGGQLLLGGLQVEAVARDLLGNGVGLLVIFGILHLGAVLLIVRRQIHQFTGGLLVVPGQGREVGVHKGVVHGLVEPFGIQLAVGVADLDRDGPGGLIDIDLRGGEGGLHLLGQLVDAVADVVGVQVQHRLQVDVALVAAAAEVVEHRGEGVAAAAVGHGLGDGLVGVQRHVGLVRRKGQGAVRQLDVQRGRGVGRGHGVGHGGHGFLTGHAADVDPGHKDVGVDGVAALEHQAVAEEDDNGQQHQRAADNGGHDSAGDAPADGFLLRLLRRHSPGIAGGRHRRHGGLTGLGGMGSRFPGLCRLGGLGRLVQGLLEGQVRQDLGEILLRPRFRLGRLGHMRQIHRLLVLGAPRRCAGRAGPRGFKFAFLSDGNRSYLFRGWAAGTNWRFSWIISL